MRFIWFPIAMLVCVLGPAASPSGWTEPPVPKTASAGELGPAVWLRIPGGLDPLIPVPRDNPLTEAGIELGRRLFFEKALSRDYSLACSTCHQPEKLFADGKPLPTGFQGRPGRRNVPSLLNVAFRSKLFWDGRAPSLEAQALEPLTHADEFANSFDEIERRLNGSTEYRALFQAAFGDSRATVSNAARALASFQRTLFSPGFAGKRFQSRQVGHSEAVRRGEVLFEGKANCSMCHSGPFFSDGNFHNTGVSWAKSPNDWGLYETTGVDGDRGRFSTPSLLEVSRTAPYMHDGSFTTLEDVVAFYNRGGVPNPNLDPAIRPLHLSTGEQSDLVQFLQSLSSP